MNINFEYDHVKASPRLEQFADGKLEKLLDKYDFIVRSDVVFKMENTSEPDSGRICSITLSVPGPRLYAEASTGVFEQSVVQVVSDLDRQLRKKKAKMKSH
jgi:putative sigma-54 modulation protein